MLANDRVRIHFQNRRDLARARAVVEERYHFWASTPYDKFESKLNLVTAVRSSAWVVFAITLGAACGSIFCTFLAWVSRRRYEIALFKAQGSGNAWVAGLYMLQGGVAGLVAGALGVLVGALVCPAIARVVSQRLELAEPVVLAMPNSIGLALVVAATGVSVLAALRPARVAARQDPWSILREAI
jgi:ABC-type lipoprotein release transport system permease subunit